ncbi:MAG: hypothetical protein HZC24_07030 [Rhodocyclales bacterium]|nr:hypothetical protein [Rhodocyclales bacterium]
MENAKLLHANDERHNDFFDQIVRFAAKTAVVVILVALGVKWVTPELRQGFGDKWAKLAQELGRDQPRLMLTGFLVRNPAVHWKVSEVKEREGDLAGAAEELELAVGLLEMSRADPAVLRRYQDRLAALRHPDKPATGRRSQK